MSVYDEMNWKQLYTFLSNVHKTCFVGCKKPTFDEQMEQIGREKSKNRILYYQCINTQEEYYCIKQAQFIV